MSLKIMTFKDSGFEDRRVRRVESRKDAFKKRGKDLPKHWPKHLVLSSCLCRWRKRQFNQSVTSLSRIEHSLFVARSILSISVDAQFRKMELIQTQIQSKSVAKFIWSSVVFSRHAWCMSLLMLMNLYFILKSWSLWAFAFRVGRYRCCDSHLLTLFQIEIEGNCSPSQHVILSEFWDSSFVVWDVTNPNPKISRSCELYRWRYSTSKILNMGLWNFHYPI